MSQSWRITGELEKDGTHSSLLPLREAFQSTSPNSDESHHQQSS